MPGRSRAAALAVLALTAAGCGSSSPERAVPLPVTGPRNVVRVAVADLLWPLEPERAETRDERVVARMLFSTPLRTDADGELRPGLCTSWRPAGRRGWRLRCSHAGAIAAHLRRVKLFSDWGVAVRGGGTLVITPPSRDPDLPYRLTQVAAAPPGVPGPFRLVSASPSRIVAERNRLRIEVRKLQPLAALRAFRAGRLDEAPVPLGDIRAAKLDRQLRRAVRVRRLLAADAVVFSPTVPADVRSVFDDTADRADYQALVPEFEAPPAESLAERGQPSASRAAIALREARKRIPSLPQVAVRFAQPDDPTLAYGTSLLVGAWRDLGLGAVAGGGRAARLERLTPGFPRARELERLGASGRVVPIAWVADARLVSPRLRGWREDALGNVDYAAVRLRGQSRRR